MKTEEFLNNDYPKSVVMEPMEPYYTPMSAPKRVHEDLRISMEQADNGELISMDDVLARYK